MELSVYCEDPEINVTIQVPLGAQFDYVMTLLRTHLADSRICSFEYVDDEEDKLIVRNDDDLQAVYCYYSGMLENSRRQGCPPPPLQVVPRITSTDAPPIVSRDLILPAVLPHSRSHFQHGSFSQGAAGVKVTPQPPTSHLIRPNGSSAEDKSNSNEFVRRNSYNTGNSSASSLECPTATDIPSLLSSSLDNPHHVSEKDVHVICEIGHGQNGRVFRALHISTQNVIAIKSIDLNLAEAEQRQIMAELSILTRCHSPAIIDFYGAFFTGSSINICTEFMDGSSLDRYRRVPIHILCRISCHLINGLTYLQQNKIMHRDVKPSNMLLNTRGQCKLCDFGVSIQLVESIARTYTGTCAYMAPERLLGAEYRFASDVWSLGVSLYELGAGRLPFLLEGESPLAGQLAPNVLMDRIVAMKEPPPIVLSDNNSVCPFLSHFVNQCLSPLPESRPSATTMIGHPLYAKYFDTNTSLISHWVIEKLEGR